MSTVRAVRPRLGRDRSRWDRSQACTIVLVVAVLGSLPSTLLLHLMMGLFR